MAKKERNCEDCKKRKAIIEFSNEPFLAISHGWGITYLCRECYIKRVEKHLKDVQENLGKQKLLLKESR
jgi:hypothetical protein